MENEKPTYYAVIPAEVRYNKKLIANAKLLYGEITALCSSEGYCWANNRYFSTLYGVSNKTIITWLNSLKNCGVIDIKYYPINSGKDLSKRKIYIVNTPGRKLHTPRKKTSRGVRRKGNAGYEENFSHNNTKNNTTNVIFNDSHKDRKKDSKAKENKNKPSLDEFAEYCLDKSLYFDYKEFYTVNESRYHWAKPWTESISIWCRYSDLMPKYYVEQELCKFIREIDSKNEWLKKHEKLIL